MDLTGWTPVRVRGDRVEWRWTGAARFTEPAFDQTVERCLRRPFSLLFPRETPIEALAGGPAGLEPDGFVFHLSRCGSTLVSQMLAALDRHRVLSEPPPVDAVLRAPVDEETRVTQLRWLVGALGRPLATEDRFFMKLDSWSTLELPLVRRAFPDVPWIFVYRDPLEVMVSHARVRGAHVVPGALSLGMPDGLPADEYGARVLAAICDAALAEPGGVYVNYRQLPEVVPELFGIEYADDEVERMLATSEANAKNPSLPFVDDTDAKRAEATPRLHELTERWLQPAYDRLERARTAETIAC